MPLLPSNFKADDHDDMGVFKAMPEGIYALKIISSDTKLTKDAKTAKDKGVQGYKKIGTMLVLEMEVLSGKYQGHKHTVRLNIENKSEKAMELAFNELATIQRATDTVGCQQTEDLHGIPMNAELAIKPASGQWGESNYVKIYKKYDADKLTQFASNKPQAEKVSVGDLWAMDDEVETTEVETAKPEISEVETTEVETAKPEISEVETTEVEQQTGNDSGYSETEDEVIYNYSEDE